MPERRPLSRRQIYRRRRAVVFGGIGLVLAGLVYLPLTLLAPLPAAAVSVEAPERTAPEVPALAFPGYGASGLGALGYPGVLAQSGTTEPRPMASITKVITALVVLEAHPLAVGEEGPSVTMTAADAALYGRYLALNGTVSTVRAGLTFSERDLLELTLVKSANNYTTSLATWAFGSEDGFVAAARDWLARHGLDRVVVNEPTGIDPSNVAPVDQLIELGKIALAHPVIAELVAASSVDVPHLGAVPNTNVLLGMSGIDGIKTGTLDDFGANLLFSADTIVGSSTVTIVGVVLGGPDHPTINRDILALVGTAFANFTEVEVAADAQAFAFYDPVWGEPVAAVAAERVTLLTWAGAPVTVEVVTDEVRTGEAGRDVGDIVVSSGPTTATVDLELATELADPGPWWRLTNPVALF